MKAIVLAGGLGKRLRPLTDTTPKPMIPIAGKPVLLWQIEWLKRHGVDSFVLCVGYLRERITEFFGDGAKFGVRIDYVFEDQPLGTGGALRNAAAHFPQNGLFFAFNGDVISDIPLSVVRRRCEEGAAQGALGAIALAPLPSPYGVVETDDDGFIKSFTEKPRLPDYWINAGVYCLHAAIADHLPETGSIEREVFPKLAAEGKLVASKHPDCYWQSIDSPKDVEEAAAFLGRESP